MQEINIKKPGLDAILGTLQPPERVHRTAWRLRVSGSFVRLRTGKHMWTRRGDAINALRIHISYITRCRDGATYVVMGINNEVKILDGEHDPKDITKYLLDNGHVELVEIPIDD